MIAAPLPALAVVAPVAPQAPAAAAASASPGAFAHELHQAQATTPADSGAPEAQTAASADGDAPDKPAAPADEAPVSKSLRQWLQQTAAARRAAHKPGHDPAAVKARTTGDAARDEALDPTSRHPRGLRKDDADTPTLAALAGGPATAQTRVDAQAEPDARTTPGPANDASAETQTQDAIATALPVQVPVPPAGPTFAAAVPQVAAAGPQAAATATAVTLSDVPADRPDQVPDADAEPESVAAGAEGRAGMRAALTERAAAGAKTESAVEPPRGGAAAAAKSQREHVTEAAPRPEESDTFAAALARQTEGMAIVVPPSPQATGGAPRADAAATAARPPVDVPVPTDFQSPQWAQSVGNQLSLLATDGVQNARLHLHPAEMGPISVQIVVDGQTAQVHLGVDNAETRQALEQAMPNLAASLRESGLTLTGGGVFEQPRQSADQAPADGRSSAARSGERGGRGDLADPAATVANAPRAIRRQGVVDMYA